MNKIEIQKILEHRYVQASWIKILRDVFAVKKIFESPNRITGLPTNEWTDEAYELGNFYTSDERLIGIYEVHINKKDANLNRNRVGLRSVLRKIYKYDVDGALIVFVQGGKWRFSYVSEVRAWNEDGELIELKTEPKRFTYLLGEGETARTAAQRFEGLAGKTISLQNIRDAFSVEKLNKEFFTRYRELYQLFCKSITDDLRIRDQLIDRKQTDHVKQEKPIRDLVKLLLGRIVFLHFLQKKGWMGCDPTTDGWQNGDLNFMHNLWNNVTDKKHFHTKCLRELFFNTLNNEDRKNFIFSITNTKVPYLNGGLFDRDITAGIDIDFDPQLFDWLFDFFAEYNFTIDENDPYDNEVGIDPEMLGHIFENLLEENREKGTFYTPKEIVHYMCQESLIRYLRAHLPECTEDESPATIQIERLIRYGETGDRNDKGNVIARKGQYIEELLDKVKICDPAIGSGAFPMGVLQEIYKAKLALDFTLNPAKVKRDIIENSIYGVDLEMGAVDIARLRFWLALVVDEEEPQPLPNLDYKIMQGNSLLERFENIDLADLSDKEDDDILIAQKGQFEIPEFSLRKQSIMVFDKASKEELYQLINDYYDFEESKQKGYKDKQEIKKRIDEIVEGKLRWKITTDKLKLRDSIHLVNEKLKGNKKTTTDTKGVSDQKDKNTKQLQNQLDEMLKSLAELDKSLERLQELEHEHKPKPYFLWHLWFKDVFEEGGFDIVIANPPYIQLQKMGVETDVLEQATFETFNRTGDIYCLFYEKGVSLLKKGGLLCFITSNSWMRTRYGQPLRKFFREKTNPKVLLNFEDTLLFETAVVETNILIAKKEKFDQKLHATSITKDYIPESSISEFALDREIVLQDLNDEGWGVMDKNTIGLMKRIEDEHKRIGQMNVSINFGIKTGLNEAFIIDEKTKREILKDDKHSEDLMKPLLRGRDLKRYIFDFQNQWLINAHNGLKKEGLLPIDVEKEYPAVFKHFKKFETALRSRSDKANHWTNLRNCAYLRELDRPKIIWGELSDRPKFAYDEQGIYPEATLFFMVGKNLKYLLSILNSKVGEWYFNRITTTSGMGTNRWKKYKIEKLPIPVVQNEQMIESLVTHIITAKKEHLNTIKWENKIDAIVFHLYGLNEEEMGQILDSFKDLSIVDRNQIQNEYRNWKNGRFEAEI